MDLAALLMGHSFVQPILFSLAAFALLLGSWTDLKTREVPDMLNYGLVMVGLSFNAFLSILFWDYHLILNSILGLTLCFGIGWVMLYAGQWGGGDSKMLMGLGALFGLPLQLADSLLLSLLLNILLAGAAYGAVWSFWLMVKNRKKFRSSFERLTAGKFHRLARIISLGLLALFGIILFSPFRDYSLKLGLLWLFIFPPLLYYAFLFVKAIEKSSMYILLPIRKITEGDWIAKDVFIKGKRICGPKDLGISREQIRTLQKYEKNKLIRKVLIKQGIPFVPSFLLAFLFTLAWGNPFLFLMGFL